MRKQQKEKLLRIINLLQKNFDMVSLDVTEHDLNHVIDTLMDLQVAAIACGNSIELSEGEDSPIIHQLESLCDLLYQMSVEIQQTKWNLNKQLQISQILQFLYNDISNMQTKLEVLFMPYQVSMWDSLESVWLAAKDDPSVDTYVMPIPCYDVLGDNSLGTMHYEGDCYPKEVPITNYRDYSIEERRPDIIFIHNPYDESNTVTRVPERYFARNLCKYTEHLIYIPYMASEEDGPAYGQTHTPGVLWANKVIVQAGKVYENYCRGYMQFLQENGIENRFPKAEDKFLPLGSPKFDKLVNMQSAVEHIPLQWEKLIQKSDGTRKKVILYNITIGTMLQQNEQLLKKIRSVFSLFKQNRDIVLLWRPHPLLFKTINSMLPDMREEYLSIVEEYKKEGWGIYDDTPDPNLAVALSDAYYGDMSSLLTTYRATGKPILLQDVNVL